MNSDFFIKVAKADGESKKEGHSGEIEVLSWAWGLSNASSAGVGGGAGKGKAVPQDLTFMHNYDKASPVLAKFCADGTHIDEVKLTARKSGGGQEDYLVITLKSAFITGCSFSASSGGDIVESVSMAFKEIKTEYKFQDDKGKLSNGPELTWNIETGKIS